MGDPEGRGLGTPAATGNGLAVRPEPPGVWGRSGYDDGSPLDKWDHRRGPGSTRVRRPGSPCRNARGAIQDVVEDRLERVTRGAGRSPARRSAAASTAARSRAIRANGSASPDSSRTGTGDRRPMADPGVGALGRSGRVERVAEQHEAGIRRVGLGGRQARDASAIGVAADGHVRRRRDDQVERRDGVLRLALGQVDGARRPRPGPAARSRTAPCWRPSRSLRGQGRQRTLTPQAYPCGGPSGCRRVVRSGHGRRTGRTEILASQSVRGTMPIHQRHRKRAAPDREPGGAVAPALALLVLARPRRRDVAPSRPGRDTRAEPSADPPRRRYPRRRLPRCRLADRGGPDRPRRHRDVLRSRLRPRRRDVAVRRAGPGDRRPGRHHDPRALLPGRGPRPDRSGDPDPRPRAVQVGGIRVEAAGPVRSSRRLVDRRDRRPPSRPTRGCACSRRPAHRRLAAASWTRSTDRHALRRHRRRPTSRSVARRPIRGSSSGRNRPTTTAIAARSGCSSNRPAGSPSSTT